MVLDLLHGVGLVAWYVYVASLSCPSKLCHYHPGHAVFMACYKFACISTCDHTSVTGQGVCVLFTGKSKGEEGSAGPAGFSSWISRELGRAEALLKVVGSRPDTLADNFFTLMPSGTLPDYQRIIDLKVCIMPLLLGKALRNSQQLMWEVQKQ